MIDLAQQIVRDGEGAEKFVTIDVDRRGDRRARRGASASRSATRRWSRRRSPPATPIGAASSWRSARPARRPTATSSSIAVGGMRIAEKGGPVPGYDEAPVAEHMAGREIHIARRSRRRQRPRDGLDLRPDAPLHRHQWQLPELIRFPSLLVVAVALIDADGRVLLAQRPPGKAMAGLVGISRRQDAGRRDARGGAHPRARGRARHRRRPKPASRPSPSPRIATSASTC